MAEEKPLVFVRTASGLVKEFGLRDIIMMTWATPIAGGLMFFTVATATLFAGQSMVVALLVCGLCFVVMAATMGCLAAAMPRAGGMYVAISRLV
jgi:amino acid transporter